jgi:hypothetical protein
MAFEKKGIYHSDLVKAGPTKVMINGIPKDGRYGKYIALRIEGKDHNLTLENDEIVRTISQFPVGAHVTLKASGGKNAPKMDVDGETPVGAGVSGSTSFTGTYSYASLPSFEEDLQEAVRLVREHVPVGLDEGQQKVLTAILYFRRDNPGRHIAKGEGATSNASGDMGPVDTSSAPDVIPPPAQTYGDTRKEDTEVEKKTFYLHRRFTGGKYGPNDTNPNGLNWIEVANLGEEGFGYIRWTIEKSKASDEQKKWLEELLAEYNDPFAEPVVAGADGKNLFD